MSCHHHSITSIGDADKEENGWSKLPSLLLNALIPFSRGFQTYLFSKLMHICTNLQLCTTRFQDFQWFDFQESATSNFKMNFKCRFWNRVQKRVESPTLSIFSPSSPTYKPSTQSNMTDSPQEKELPMQAEQSNHSTVSSEMREQKADEETIPACSDKVREAAEKDSAGGTVKGERFDESFAAEDWRPLSLNHLFPFAALVGSLSFVSQPVNSNSALSFLTTFPFHSWIDSLQFG